MMWESSEWVYAQPDNPEPPEPEEEDEEIVTYCANCDEPIYSGDKALAFVHRSTQEWGVKCLCKDCMEELKPEGVFDLMDVRYYSGESGRTLREASAFCKILNEITA